MTRKYKFHNKSAAYFVSFATVYWLDIFIRQDYFSILEESVAFCRAEKGMEVFAYCFMPSHIHFVFRSDQEDPSGLLRDFKGYTARKLIKEIEENPQESRKEWLLWMLERAGKKKSNVSQRQLWQQHNKPIELWSNKVIKQKIEYIHNNPVEAGFVTDPVDWKYSSARNYAEDQTILKIDNENMNLGML
ncbi:transposase [Arenibacter sp. 6A1]|uniref:REP-associated tyrosine transposase n=1 Tax=Arenibacter sp. 6A1 TaxID=2720391 RepID=UPI0014475B76|nr:transposase [Arenibacter sp. 6A1]NKI26630.1 transposase [Arenibacter sp. 6A1]